MPNRSSYTEALNEDIFRPNTTAAGSRSPSWLLPGEEIKLKETSVGYQSYWGKVVGNVWVTNYRMRFQRDSVNDSEAEEGVVDISLGSVSKVTKKGYSRRTRNPEDLYGIQIKCKDMRKIFLYHNAATHSRRELYNNLRMYAFPNTNKLPFFATVYKGHFKCNGWSIYDAVTEFKRQGVPNKFWQFTNLNQNYEFAVTYPSCLVLPVAAVECGENFIRSVGDFRSKKRIPVLSWYNKHTHATIVRSAQPMVGVTSKRSSDDEKLLQMIIEANPGNDRLLILDARPLVNARVNKATGGGFEDNYSNCDIEFKDIQNIHVVRDSLKRVKSACYPRIDLKNFYKSLDDSRWLAHIQTILNSVRQIITAVLGEKRSVLIHCSDGWDRTAQLTSLSMLQMDAYYRTLEGFLVLMEKEWCSFGHKFAHRIGHGQDKHGDEERSPIFVQFLDCVWQLFNQHTAAFEFNVQLLKTILDELYACRFGTFLYNNEKERNDLEVKKNTVSLWSYVVENRDVFLNTAYDPQVSTDPSYFLNCAEKPLCAKLWTDYYCRYNPQVVAQEDLFMDNFQQDTVDLRRTSCSVNNDRSSSHCEYTSL